MCYATIKLKHAFACKINIILYNFYIEFFRFLYIAVRLFLYSEAIAKFFLTCRIIE